jgi:thiamine biosynthesis lipoprotein
VSDLLYEAVRFAVAVAEQTSGAFDPTVGARMERRGFDREHRTGTRISTESAWDDDVTFRDVELDPERRTIRLGRPLVLDLGAVAKGLAIDLAARELAAFDDFAVNAGGDLYLGGCNPEGRPWSVGIRHPRQPGTVIESVRVSNQAVCTSGDYERLARGANGEHHILDPRSGTSPGTVASATVVASSAMLADALATAAFVLGPIEGIALLERHGAHGLIVTTDVQQHRTPGFPS